jgi:Protein of unknown function (DUF1778)
MPADERAHAAVRRAIVRGELLPATSLPCADCGADATNYHHHLGYAPEHWLAVVAVCGRCHWRRHPRRARPKAPSVVTHAQMTPDQVELIKRAAAVDNRTVNNFLVTAALREAEVILARTAQREGR